MAQAQHTQKRQQAELDLDLELDAREPWAYQEVCPACGHDPMTCDCDLHE